LKIEKIAISPNRNRKPRHCVFSLKCCMLLWPKHVSVTRKNWME